MNIKEKGIGICAVNICNKKTKGWIDIFDPKTRDYGRLRFCKEHFTKIMIKGKKLDKEANKQAKEKGFQGGGICAIPINDVNQALKE